MVLIQNPVANLIPFSPRNRWVIAWYGDVKLFGKMPNKVHFLGSSIELLQIK
jgi:hypothetical protein